MPLFPKRMWTLYLDVLAGVSTPGSADCAGVITSLFVDSSSVEAPAVDCWVASEVYVSSYGGASFLIAVGSKTPIIKCTMVRGSMNLLPIK